MAENSKTFLKTPVGTEGMHIQDAFRHRIITRILEDTLCSWGYLPVQIPEFDFFDAYRHLFREDDLDRIYRLVDREGDVLMLRSDMTLFLARHLGLHLTDSDLPSRVCYADSILRHENREDISRNEFFQAGAELVGISGERGDLEILSLAYTAFAAIGLNNVKIHLGSRAALAACAGSSDKKQLDLLAEAVSSRDPGRISQYVDQKHKAALTELLLFIGTPQEAAPLIDSIRSLNMSETDTNAITYPSTLVALALEVLPPTSVVLDYSEVGGQPYYTGTVFRGYLDGVDSEVLSGGRYDNLLSHFGFRCPSTGFSILLRKIEPLIGRTGEYAVPTTHNAVGSTFADALKDAQVKRANGEVVTLKKELLTLALPKGRLTDQVAEFFAERSMSFSFDNRELIAEDQSSSFRIFLVKNSDLPTYVKHGIAGLGICGEDVLYESGNEFYRLMRFPFGSTSMCVAGKSDISEVPNAGRLTVATKFTRFTQDYFHSRGIPVEIIKLGGSVELAPLLGLAPFIVDLVETGNTLKANNLKILEKLKDIGVFLIANPAYYKLKFRRINSIVQKLMR